MSNSVGKGFVHTVLYIVNECTADRLNAYEQASHISTQTQQNQSRAYKQSALYFLSELHPDFCTALLDVS